MRRFTKCEDRLSLRSEDFRLKCCMEWRKLKNNKEEVNEAIAQYVGDASGPLKVRISCHYPNLPKGGDLISIYSP